LSALKIEREPLDAQSGGWVKWVALLVVLAAAGGGAWYFLSLERPIEVEAGTVSERAAGAQASVLNASGYVTARRRAVRFAPWRDHRDQRTHPRTDGRCDSFTKPDELTCRLDSRRADSSENRGSVLCRAGTQHAQAQSERAKRVSRVSGVG
jgi:hypothetical protein